MKNEMSVGSWKDLPHYSVIGEPTNFYVWINTNNQDGSRSASSWIKGSIAFSHWNQMKQEFKKDKEKFIHHVQILHDEYLNE